MDVINIITEEIESVMEKVDRNQLEELLEYIKDNSRIFVDGEGRSGLMGKGFAMRLMHLGFEVYVVGETITPSVKSGDIYFAVSGSGESSNVVVNVKKAKEKGCTIIAVTSKINSTVGSLADKVLVVPGTTKGDSGKERKSVQLLSSLFDQSLHIVLDALCLMLSKRNEISNSEATARHW